MTQRLYALFVFLFIGAFGLFFAGCDTGGGDGNDPPSAEITVESMDSRTVNFSASESSDPDGSIVSYSWEFGDGSTATGETVSNQYAKTGTYTATLAVTDDSEASDTARTDIDLTPTTFEVTIENVSKPAPLLKSGAFTPADESPTTDGNSPPLKPGEAFEFSFTAGPFEVPGTGMSMSFASMFIRSNDVYYAFAPGGVPLYDGQGNPVGLNSPKDLTGMVNLYDAGTEADEVPGGGDQLAPNAAPNQDTLDQGDPGEGTIEKLEDSDGDGKPDDGDFSYPAVDQGIEVTISSQADDASGGHKFTVTIENVADETGTTVNQRPLLISPGSFAVHWNQTPNGEDVRYPGHAPKSEASASIERIAEDGRPAGALSSDPIGDVKPPGNHVAVLKGLTGVTVPISPGGIAAHTDDIQLFELDQPADAVVSGVERIAEDGDPSTLADNLQGNVEITSSSPFFIPDDASEAGPLVPTAGDNNPSYTVTVDAVPGDRLSLSTMYVQSNDIFWAFAPGGVPLYDGGSPISGDQTSKLRLYDAGTEIDEEPGVGGTQKLRQGARDARDIGPAENGNVVRIEDTDDDPYLDDDGFNYVPLTDGNGNPRLIKVTVTPQ